MVPAMAGAPGEGGVAEDQLRLSGGNPQQQAQLEGPRANYEQHLQTVQTVVKEDPKRVAQVVKNWVGEDG